METTKTSSADKTRWEELRDTVRGGVRDLRNVGDELARQGRLRMDIYQTERRMKIACEELGKAVYARFSDNRPVSAGEPGLAELHMRISYYTGELKRLHDELQKSSGAAN